MSADVAVVTSMVLIMGAIVAKLATAQKITASRSELQKLMQARDEVAGRLSLARERRLAAEGNQVFLERRISDAQVLRERLLFEVEEIVNRLRMPEPETESAPDDPSPQEGGT